MSENPWNVYEKIKPKKIDLYLTYRMDCNTGDTFYSLDRFEPQDEYRDQYSTEFKQTVRVKIKSGENDFDNRYTFVIKWMEIPK